MVRATRIRTWEEVFISEVKLIINNPKEISRIHLGESSKEDLTHLKEPANKTQNFKRKYKEFAFLLTYNPSNPNKWKRLQYNTSIY